MLGCGEQAVQEVPSACVPLAPIGVIASSEPSPLTFERVSSCPVQRSSRKPDRFSRLDPLPPLRHLNPDMDWGRHFNAGFGLGSWKKIKVGIGFTSCCARLGQSASLALQELLPQGDLRAIRVVAPILQLWSSRFRHASQRWLSRTWGCCQRKVPLRNAPHDSCTPAMLLSLRPSAKMDGMA